MKPTLVGHALVGLTSHPLTGTMRKKSPQKIFSDLVEKASDLDDAELVEYFEQLKIDGTTLVVYADEDEPEFHHEATSFTEVVQYRKLEIDGVLVLAWDSTYWGHFCGAGSGWWVERSDSSVDVENLLQVLDLLPDTPYLPEPLITDSD